MLRKLFSSTRYLIIIAVIGSFIAASVLLVYGFLNTLSITWHAFGEEISLKGANNLILEFIELTDLFLIATVLYIIAMGLYELFIDEHLELPNWLHITSLDDLKSKLVGVLVVVIAVKFLEQLYTWQGDSNILYFGGAIGLVIAALTWFLGKH